METKDLKPWEKTPSQEIFEDMKKAAIDIWLTYDNEFGYVDEKLGTVNSLTNIKDNAMVFYRMFDHNNQSKMRAKLDIDSITYINENS